MLYRAFTESVYDGKKPFSCFRLGSDGYMELILTAFTEMPLLCANVVRTVFVIAFN